MKSPFSKILGHEHARDGIWRSIAEGRLHHAILLHGLQGVGKRTLAETVARTLLCEAPDFGPCETCSHCRRTAVNIHPDLVILGRDNVFGIDESLIAHRDERIHKKKAAVGSPIDVDYMRHLGDWLTERPWEARGRLAIVVDAERMNLAAANAFLKSLEEPAPGALVMLTSSSPGFLPPTIRSRCASIRLSGVPQALLERHLMEAGVASMDARFRALASGGSLARAMQTRPPLDDLRDHIIRSLSGGKTAEAAAFAAAALAGSKETDRDATLHLFATLLRDIAVLQSGGSLDALVHREAGEALARAASGPVDPFALFSRVVEARERVAGNANRVSLWDDLLHDASSGGRQSV